MNSADAGLMIAFIQKKLEDRASWLLKKVLPCLKLGSWTGRIWIAGGCMMPGELNDVDLFFPPGVEPPEVDAKLISRTKNASTWDCKPWPVQLCMYTAPTLAELIRKFDFSFNQVGAEAEIFKGSVGPINAEFTPDYVQSMATGRADFMGSEYPLSSLIRVQKYFKSGKLCRADAIKTTVQILSEVIRRGFLGRDDFKDQLDAVDLGLVEKDWQDSIPEMERLFVLLNKGEQGACK